jgi:prepilin-type processing-associated H-X9-DG protein
MLAIGDAVLGNSFSIPHGFPSLSQVWIGPPFEFYTEIIFGQPPVEPVGQAYRLRHGARWNMGFCDGHVENLKPKNLFDISSDSVARRWNIDHEPHNAGWNPRPSP